MLKKLSTYFIGFFFSVSIFAYTSDNENSIPEINYSKFTLDNGLTVIVHEDRKVPMVAVNIWYHVGSKNEKEGKTGFAHLFEHLMFNGTENYNSEYFEPFEKIGSTDQNGTTNSDRTNYFQNVPTNALDLALWMESDRMGHLLGVVDQEKLDEQRGVVQNEKRQGENRPYGKSFDRISNGAYPKGHPYSWTTIGSMEDLDAASLDDVKEWFKTYYGPNNAVLVLAGDIDLETAKVKAQKYFGDIPPGPPLTKPSKWIGKRSEEKREIMLDNVPQTVIYKVWNTPPANTIEEVHLDLAASVFSDQKNSPLYKDLVYDQQVSTGVSAFYFGREISGLFYIAADVAPGVDPDVVEEALDESIANYLKKGPDKDLLEAEKTKTYAGYIRGLQRIGGFGGKSDILATCETYTGEPDCYKTYLENLLDTSSKDIKTTLSNWIDDTAYVLTIMPEQKLSANKNGVDRSKGIPYPTSSVSYQFPDIESATLSNGSKIYLAQRDGLPLVQMTILLSSGFAEEDLSELGYTNFMMDMLNEGTKNYSALEFDAALNAIGSSISYGSGLDSSYVGVSSLKGSFSDTLDLVIESLENPLFEDSEISRLQKQRLAGIKQEENQPRAIAYRKIGKILYGENHPYGKPLTGTGTTETIENISRDALVEVYKRVINSNNASYLIVGNINLEEAKDMLESKFGNWESEASQQKLSLFSVDLPKSRKVYLIDKPNAIQSYIVAGQLLPPTGSDDEILMEYMNYAIGGSFTSRLNMNLREDKSWSYGVRNRLADAKGQRSILVNAPVQTDKTADSIKEIIKEFDYYLGDQPIRYDELEKAKSSKTLRLPGRFETLGSLLGGMTNIVQYDRSLNYLDELSSLYSEPTLEEVQNTARKYLKPNQWSWLIVGDLKEIESEVRALNLGEVEIISN